MSSCHRIYRRICRELYLLPRWEQRAVLVSSLLLLCSLGFRMLSSLLPGPDPPGFQEFEKEARVIMQDLARQDSLRAIARDSIYRSGHLKSQGPPRKRARQPIQTIDLNHADSAALLPLPGIGPVFAGRIIRYRELLGGFIRLDQLGEVYGLPEETLQNIRGFIRIDSGSIRKIHVDSASFRELLRHPYLQYEDVLALVRYRDFCQDIQSLGEIRDHKLWADSTFRKISAYLLCR